MGCSSSGSANAAGADRLALPDLSRAVDVAEQYAQANYRDESDPGSPCSSAMMCKMPSTGTVSSVASSGTCGTTTPAGFFPVGSTVELSGLRSASHYNGQRAKVLSIDPTRHRYEIKTIDGCVYTVQAVHVKLVRSHRRCATAGCCYQATLHGRHCCFQCSEGKDHGPQCERLAQEAKPERGSKKSKGADAETHSIKCSKCGAVNEVQMPQTQTFRLVCSSCTRVMTIQHHLSVNDYLSSVKKHLSEGKIPEDSHFIAFARYLGMDAVMDHDLLWIAVDALQAPLPAYWSAHSDSKDRVFYYCVDTKKSSWTHPLEYLHRDTYKTITDFRHSMSPVQQAKELKRLQLKYDNEYADAALKALDWSQHTDEHGTVFFFNRVLRESTWTDPRPAKTHELHLLRRTLEVLRGAAEPSGGEAAHMPLGDGANVNAESLSPALVLPMSAPVVDSKELLLGLEKLPRKGKEWYSLCQLLHVGDPENLGIGRDVKSTDGRYNVLVPVHAWRIQRPNLWKIFDATRGMVSDDLRRLKSQGIVVPRVTSKLETATRWLGGMDASCNEQLLLHGTKPENLMAIIQDGLNERVSSGLLGKGVYLAEDPSKMDQYCTPDMGPSNPAMELLYDELYAGEPHPGRVYYAVVCRALLGMPVFTKNGKTNLNKPSEVIFRASDRRELAVVPDSSPAVSYHSLIAEVGQVDEGHILQRHREFVIFNCNRIAEQYIIAYTREWSDEPSEFKLPEPLEDATEVMRSVNIDDIRLGEKEGLAEAASCGLCLALPRLPISVSMSPKERLAELKDMKDSSLITFEEFEAKKKKILDEL